jgi:hypothetical protein
LLRDQIADTGIMYILPMGSFARKLCLGNAYKNYPYKWSAGTNIILTKHRTFIHGGIRMPIMLLSALFQLVVLLENYA